MKWFFSDVKSKFCSLRLLTKYFSLDVQDGDRTAERRIDSGRLAKQNG